MHLTFRSALRHITAAALVLAPVTVSAQTSYTNFAAFAAAFSITGTDSFDDLSGPVGIGPVARTAGASSYTVAAAASPFDVLYAVANPSSAQDTWLSTEDAVAPLTFSGFGSDVFGFGGRFFATDIAGAISGTSLVITAVDVLGNSFSSTINPISADAFFGVKFDNAIASFVVTANNSAFTGAAYFATANDVVLGSTRAVPEPGTVWLVAAGLGGLLVIARCRMARDAR